MAMYVNRNFRVTNGETPILVDFLPSENDTASPDCKIDTRCPSGLGGIMAGRYSLSIQLQKNEQALVMREHVSGAVYGNTVTGVLSIPITKLEIPQFDHNSETARFIKISFTVRKGQSLTPRHYEWETEGTWNEGTARSVLQMWDIDDWAYDTRMIEVTLLNPLKAPCEIMTDIERSLNLPVMVSQLAPLFPPIAVPTQRSTTPEGALLKIHATVPEPQKVVAEAAMQKFLAKENAELARNAEKEKERRLKNEYEGNIIASRSTQPVRPTSGTADPPFWGVIQKEIPPSSESNVFQSITRMYSYQRCSFEELRLADYNAGFLSGSATGQAEKIMLLQLQDKQLREKAATSRGEAEDLAEKLMAEEARSKASLEQYEDSMKKIESLQQETKHFEVRHRAGQDRNKLLQDHITDLKAQIALEAARIEASAQQDRVKVLPPSQTSSYKFYVTFVKENAKVMFARDDRAKVSSVTRTLSTDNKNSFRVDFETHELATQVLGHLKFRVHEIYIGQGNTPEVGYFCDVDEALKEDATTQTDSSPTSQRIEHMAEQKTAALREEIETLRSQASRDTHAIIFERSAHMEQVEKLRGEIRRLHLQLEVAAATASQVIIQHDSVDLLDLDYGDDGRGNNTLVNDATITSQFDPSLFLSMDDTVDVLGDAAEVPEPQQMPDWLEQVNRKITVDRTGAIRMAEGAESTKNELKGL